MNNINTRYKFAQFLERSFIFSTITSTVLYIEKRRSLQNYPFMEHFKHRGMKGSLAYKMLNLKKKCFAISMLCLLLRIQNVVITVFQIQDILLESNQASGFEATFIHSESFYLLGNRIRSFRSCPSPGIDIQRASCIEQTNCEKTHLSNIVSQ